MSSAELVPLESILKHNFEIKSNFEAVEVVETVEVFEPASNAEPHTNEEVEMASAEVLKNSETHIQN
jgi:hypothetical protein